MLIRRAEERDIPRIHELLAQVAQVHHTGRPDLFRAGGRKYTDTQLSQKINDENTPILWPWTTGSGCWATSSVNLSSMSITTS